MKKLKNNRLKTKNLLLSEHTLISTDFFFSVVVSVGLGMAWLLIANAQLIVKESMIREQSHVAKGGDILLERRVKNLAKGFPLEHMASYISEQNEDTAAFLVGIAKKESNWGKRVPQKEGKDCYNYWGYRGKGENLTWDGYTCFHTPKEAIRTVGKRIDTLVLEHKFETPREMVVWKCGWNCDGHGGASVEKWIQDVEYYYRKMKKEGRS
jgi:hypothetical protein